MLSDASVSSLLYLAITALCFLLFHISNRHTWRKIVIGAFGFMVAFSQSSELAPLLLLLVFPVFSFLLTLLVAKYQIQSLLTACSLLLLTYFVIIKQYWFVPELSWLALFSTLSLSYMLFRALHVLIEVSNGMAFKISDLSQYLRYQISPFNFFAGPINNYEDYADDEAALSEFKLSRETVTNGVCRLLFGLVKIIAISQLLFSYFLVLRQMGDLYYIASSVVFITYIYINFSGYMDIVIGIGRLFGFSIPENFDSPWMADNFTNFWSRWHITLSFFFRDYVFFPLLKAGARYTNSRLQMVILGALSSFLAFFLLGVWHGTTHMFIYLGIALGFGVTVNYIFTELVFGNNSDKTRANIYRHIAGSSAVIYFGISSTLVWPNATSLEIVLKEMQALFTLDGVLGFLATMLILIMLRVLTTSITFRAEALKRHLVWITPIAISFLLIANYLLFEITASSPPTHIYYEDF